MKGKNGNNPKKISKLWNISTFCAYFGLFDIKKWQRIYRAVFKQFLRLSDNYFKKRLQNQEIWIMEILYVNGHNNYP